MTILNGKSLASKIQDEIKTGVEKLKSERRITPGLAVILVGNDAASQLYVQKKAEACKKAGIYSIVHEMPEDLDEEAILQTISMMNQNPNIHGILVQLPLPKQINTFKVLEAIDPRKDVDGFHPFNLGRLFAGLKSFVPATPLGVMRLLNEYDIDVKGLNAVVVGASNIVGKPMASLLLNAGATVDICHIHTRDLKEHTLKGDIVVVGVGKANLIDADMIKDGAIIIDIGINKTEEGKLVGDVEFDGVSKKASYITPVPGGVGPMTIAMLLSNTLEAASAS